MSAKDPNLGLCWPPVVSKMRLSYLSQNEGRESCMKSSGLRALQLASCSFSALAAR